MCAGVCCDWMDLGLTVDDSLELGQGRRKWWTWRGSFGILKNPKVDGRTR
jgi:hypothetical protein